MERPDYQSPLSSMYQRSWENYNQAEERRRHATDVHTPAHQPSPFGHSQNPFLQSQSIPNSLPDGASLLENQQRQWSDTPPALLHPTSNAPLNEPLSHGPGFFNTRPENPFTSAPLNPLSNGVGAPSNDNPFPSYSQYLSARGLQDPGAAALTSFYAGTTPYTRNEPPSRRVRRSGEPRSDLPRGQAHRQVRYTSEVELEAMMRHRAAEQSTPDRLSPARFANLSHITGGRRYRTLDDGRDDMERHRAFSADLELRAQALNHQIDTLTRARADIEAEMAIEGGHDSMSLDNGNDGRPEPKEKDEMMVMLECRVCYEQVVDTVCLPCGHAVLCRWCADIHIPSMRTDKTRPKKLSTCPVCRKAVKQKVRASIMLHILCRHC